MHVIKQELFKSFIRKSVAAILILLLCLNASLLFADSSKLREVDRNVRNNIFSYVLNLPSEKRLEYVESHINELLQDKEGKTVYFSDNFYDEFIVFSDIKDQLNHLNGYDEYLSGIREKVDSSKISIFQSTSEYTKKDQKLTAEAFKKLEGIKLSFVNSQGVIDATESSSIDVFAISFILFFVVSLVLYEKENGLFNLFGTMRDGKTNLIYAKILVAVIVSLISAVLFWGSSFFISMAVNKPMDLTAPIQSVQTYGSCALPISIGEYLLLFLLAKILVYCLISLSALLISLKAKGTTMLYLSFGIVFVVSTIARNNISANSVFGLLHYINLIPFIQVTPVLKYYFNLNILGMPVSMIRIFVVSSLLVLILLIVYVTATFNRGRYASSFNRVKLNIGFLKKQKTGTSLLYHEAYKLLIMHKGIVVIFALLIFQVYLVNGNRGLSRDEMFYKNYMIQLQGEWNEEKERIIDEYSEEFEKMIALREETEKKFQNKEISEAERNAAMKYISENMDSYAAFQRVINRVNEMKEKRFDEKVLVYETGYNQLMGKGYSGYQDELIQAVLLTSSIIILFSTSTGYEYSTGMINIINTLKNGRRKTVFVKLIIGLAVSTIMYICTYLPSFLAINNVYTLKYFNYGMHAIPNFDGVLNPNLPIWAYLSIVYGIRLLMCYLTMFLSMEISAKIKKSNVSLAVLIGIIVLPLVLRVIGISWIDYISLNSLYSGNILFTLVL